MSEEKQFSMSPSTGAMSKETALASISVLKEQLDRIETKVNSILEILDEETTLIKKA